MYVYIMCVCSPWCLSLRIYVCVHHVCVQPMVPIPAPTSTFSRARASSHVFDFSFMDEGAGGGSGVGGGMMTDTRAPSISPAPLLSGAASPPMQPRMLGDGMTVTPPPATGSIHL
jgi:hypothetical protein